MLNNVVPTNTNIMIIAFEFTELDKSQITTLLYDITSDLDSMNYQCIYTPQEGCTCHKWFGNNPYFYDDELDVWGFCIAPHKFTPQNLIDAFTKWKRINNIDKLFYMSYNYCDTFWMPYSHKIRGFADALHTTKKTFLDAKIMSYAI